MSPLAHSLLALGVLIAASHAVVIDRSEPPGSLCDGIEILIVDPVRVDHRMQISFEFQSIGDEDKHDIVDHCKQLGLKTASQTVRVCNGFKSPSAPHWAPPRLKALGNIQMTPIYASCEGNPECKPIQFQVNQTCI